jgi:hypothetical protein
MRPAPRHPAAGPQAKLSRTRLPETGPEPPPTRRLRETWRARPPARPLPTGTPAEFVGSRPTARLFAAIRVSVPGHPAPARADSSGPSPRARARTGPFCWEAVARAPWLCVGGALWAAWTALAGPRWLGGCAHRRAGEASHPRLPHPPAADTAGGRVQRRPHEQPSPIPGGGGREKGRICPREVAGGRRGGFVRGPNGSPLSGRRRPVCAPARSPR